MPASFIEGPDDGNFEKLPGLGRSCGGSSASREWAVLLRPQGLRGIEALHARFRRHRYRRHAHDLLTVAYVERGAATFELEGVRHVAPAGSTFVIPAFAAHTGEAATADGYLYRVLYVEPELLFDDRRPTARGAAELVERRREVVRRDTGLSRSLRAAHAAIAGHAAPLRRDELVTAALAELARLADLLPVTPSRGDGHLAVRTVRARIRADPAANVTLEALARDANVSKFHLVRLFRREMGLTPHDYQRQLRVECAKRLLRHGMPAAEVAAAAGFCDQSHLTRTFRAVVGVPPVRYARATAPRPRASRGAAAR
jgi:AraC-like DNA-binding protein